MCANKPIRGAARTRKNRGGFSLVELLAVMAIVAMLSTLAVTSYFSAIRGMTSRTARDNFYNALMMARQRACIDGCRVSLIIFNDAAAFDAAGTAISDLAASFVVCRELGRFSFVGGNGNLLFDEFSDLGSLFRPKQAGDSSSTSHAGAVKLYNLSRGTWTLVGPYVDWRTVGSSVDLLYSGGSFSINAHALERLTGSGTASGSGVSWETGDSYGVEITPVKALPKGYVFDELNNNLSSMQTLTEVKSVTFEPDGTVLQSVTFTIRSQTQDPNVQGTKFTVSTQGDITVTN
ncbi:MAG TPA: type II secretion system protein [Candidatus Latescibacteria bacterium]|nr:type II secretion system protein [Candidatus Latescibacterota bacterium]